jgi:PST family polysaccharide transporter
MRAKLNSILTSQFFSVSVFTSLSTAIKLITSFLSAKIIAIYIGPEGLGMLGQLSSFIAIALSGSTGAINNGVIKYLSEYQDDEVKQHRILNASLKITLMGSIITGSISIIFSSFWSTLLFNELAYSYIFIVLGATLFCHAIFMLFSSVLNGLREYRKYNQLAIVASMLGLITTYLFIRYYGIRGGMISLVLYQAFVFVAVLIFYKSLRRIQWRNIWKQKALQSDYKSLMAFSIMALVTTAITPATQIFIRKYMGIHTSAIEVGFYEGVLRISQLYLLIITTTLSVYYLPKLSGIKNAALLRSELGKGYSYILPATALILVVVFLLRYFVINIVFAPSFEPMADYFIPQLIGDFFKIGSWLLAFLMIAKAKTKLYITTELLFGGFLILFSVIGIQYFGAIGALYAYAFNYVLYFILMVFVFSKIIWLKR